MVVSFHGTDLTVSAHDPAWSTAYSAMLRRADSVTVVSRFLERRLRGLGYDRDVEIVPAGVRLTSFPFAGAPRPGGAPRILFVGRLVAVKGADTAIEALARLRAEGLEATLRIVGDGPLRSRMEDLARTAGIQRAVEFMGTKAHEEVRRELERADVVVVPSRQLPDGQTEGSSVVSKEAQAIGRPVVATNVGGIPETLPPELRPELVPAEEPPLLAARIRDIWEQRDRWPARVARQREWVAEEFAWEAIAQRLSEIYERVLADRPPPPAAIRRRLRTL